MKKIAIIFIVLPLLLAYATGVQAASCGDASRPRPTVVSTVPVNGATGVALNPTISISFSDDMDDSTIVFTNKDDGNIRLRKESGSVGVAISCTYNGAPTPPPVGGIANCTPSANLEPNTYYRVRVYDNVKSDNGCKMASNYDFYFTTGAGAGDTTAPTIISVSPAHNSTGNPVTTSITINFSEPMTASTIDTSNITMTDGATTITGTVAYIAVSNSATFTPSANLAPNTIYTVTAKTPQVKDAAGNALNVSNSPVTTTPASYQWNFRTITTDTTRPTITSVSPANNATGVSVATTVYANFSEALDPATVTTLTFTLKAGATSIAGAVTYDAALFRAIFTPTSNLSNSTTYTATITTGVRDVAGNALASSYTWVFTTVSATVTTAMTNFCQTPPFITTGTRIKPNVLLIVDNSGSMGEFAYKTAGKGSSTWDDSYNSASDYYGYFDTSHMYKYTTTSGGFFEIDTTLTLDKTSFWSGNFLNWLTMRRVDVVRKVLVGGKTSPRSASTANYLIGYENPDRDTLKSYASKYYEIDRGTSYGQIGVCNSSSCSSYTNTYNIKVYVGNNPPEEGIIIKMQDQIRFGIEFFNDGYAFENNQNSVRDGGYIGVDLGSTGTNLITQIENTDPSTWTPLAESLYEATRYYQAAASAYNGGTYSGKDPIEYPCQKNFVLILTDGESTKDQNLPGGAFSGTEITDITGGNFNVQTWMDKIAAIEGYTSQKATSANSSGGTYYLEGVSYYAHSTDFRSSTLGKSDIAGKQNLSIYTVFAFDDSAVGRDLLRKTAKYGGYIERDSTPGPNLVSEWDKNGDGIPDTYFEAQQGGLVGEAIQKALNDILAQVASGTATSILSSSEGSGATIMQAIFFPKKIFSTGTEVTWLGEVQNMWYFLDPKVNNSRVREDTDSNFTLNLVNDYIIESYYDTVDGVTKVNRYRDTDGDGAPNDVTPFDTISLDTISSLWRAGSKLWSRDVSTTPRTIYTTLNSTSLINFLSTTDFDPASTTVQGLLQAANSTEAAKIINYTHGLDQTGYRPRNATISGTSGIWKLGDIISSTPKVQSKFSLNTYQKTYNDKSYSAFINSSNYKGRGMTYVGANDGMLHAINFGTLDQATSGATRAKLCQDDNSDGACGALETTTSNLGKEAWAFIPKNVIPYLKYMTDPNYCHIYTVDLTPTLFDASIGDTGCDLAALASDPTTLSTTGYWDCPKYQTDNTPYTTERWRTILIGGMRLGGACKDTATTNGVGVPVSGAGYSSYFALDVTNPASPQLLWEFVPPTRDLGYATSGPAIMRINARDKGATTSTANKYKNGRWFAVFASGPTGPINTANSQFKGFSDQPLKLFVLDLKTGDLVRTIDKFADGTTALPANAFGGALYNGNIDYDFDYQDDALYLGYTQSEVATPTGTTKWLQGGVLRLITKEDLSGNTVAGTALDPANWEVSTVMSGIGAVTSAIAHLAHYSTKSTSPDKAFLFFGTGRYFYNIPSDSDDPSSQRRIFGVSDPCLSNILNNQSCGSSEVVSFSTLTEATTSAGTTDPEGWYINLDAPTTGTLFNERVVTDPLAATTGAVFFTSFAPSTDVCSFGGKSYLWAVKYDTGGTVSGYVKGIGLLQLSTGAIEEINLGTDITQREGRRTGVLEGVPPTGQGLSLIIPPKPIDTILHIRKK